MLVEANPKNTLTLTLRLSTESKSDYVQWMDMLEQVPVRVRARVRVRLSIESNSEYAGKGTPWGQVRVIDRYFLMQFS
jgi:hypothetical protein